MTNKRTQDITDENLSLGSTEFNIFIILGSLILVIGMLFMWSPLAEFYATVHAQDFEKNGIYLSDVPGVFLSLAIVSLLSFSLLGSGLYNRFRKNPTEASVIKGLIAGALLAIISLGGIYYAFSHDDQGRTYSEREIEWAQKRYGVTYDKVISYKPLKGFPRQSYLENNGKTVAQVKFIDGKAYLWSAEENAELPVTVP